MGKNYGIFHARSSKEHEKYMLLFSSLEKFIRYKKFEKAMICKIQLDICHASSLSPSCRQATKILPLPVDKQGK